MILNLGGHIFSSIMVMQIISFSYCIFLGGVCVYVYIHIKAYICVCIYVGIICKSRLFYVLPVPESVLQWECVRPGLDQRVWNLFDSLWGSSTSQFEKWANFQVEREFSGVILFKQLWKLLECDFFLFFVWFSWRYANMSWYFWKSGFLYTWY